MTRKERALIWWAQQARFNEEVLGQEIASVRREIEQLGLRIDLTNPKSEAYRKNQEDLAFLRSLQALTRSLSSVVNKAVRELR